MLFRSYIGYGVVTATENAAWDTIGLTWATANRVWDSSEYNPASISLLFCGTADTALYKGDTGNTANGTNLLVSIEKTGNAHYSNQEPDDTVYKYIKSIWPRISANDGVEISVEVATQDRLSNSISWTTPQTFTVGTDEKIDFDVSGRYWGVKFSSQSDISWKLQGYDVDVVPQGKY